MKFSQCVSVLGVTVLLTLAVACSSKKSEPAPTPKVETKAETKAKTKAKTKAPASTQKKAASPATTGAPQGTAAGTGTASTGAPAPSEPAEPTEAKPAEDAKVSGEIVIYSGRSAGLIEPLLKVFETKTGVKVKTRFDKSTATLANRLATEGAQTEADVFFAQDSGYLGALARAGHLDAIPETILSRVDTSRRDGKGLWVATSGRARVLVYSPDRVKKDELPSKLADLTDPKWKGRLGWAPSNSSFQAHVSALRKLWGEEQTRSWLKGVAALKPTVYPKNSPQVKAVSNGEIDMGWVNHYYLHKLKAANPKLKAANHSFSDLGDAGNVMMLSGVAVLKHSKNKAAARRFVQFLLSDEAQSYFAQKVYEYPVVSGVAHHPDVPQISTAMAMVDQEALADVAGTVKLLRELGLRRWQLGPPRSVTPSAGSGCRRWPSCCSVYSLVGLWLTYLAPPGLIPPPLSMERVWPLLGRTLALAGMVSLVALLIGSWLAWVEVRCDLPGRRLLSTLSLLPLAVPSYLLATITREQMAPASLLGELFGRSGQFTGFWPSVWVLSIACTPYVHLPLQPHCDVVRHPKLRRHVPLERVRGGSFGRSTCPGSAQPGPLASYS